MSTAGRVLMGAVGLVVAATLASCTSKETPHPPASTTLAQLPGGGEGATKKAVGTPTATRRRTVAPTKAKAKATTAAAKVREVDRACPYISNSDEEIAEGKRVGRSTVLTSSPVGCRFYLAYPDYHVVTQITVKKYASALAAFNLVARTGGATAESTPGIGDGAVLYRSKFYTPDGDQDWSCIFAKGKTVVTIHTDELHSSIDARNVALRIVSKF
jgi:hypothetical protein